MAKIMIKGITVDYFAEVGSSASSYSVEAWYYTCGSYRMTSDAVMEILKRYFPKSVIGRCEPYVACDPETLHGSDWRIYINMDHVHKEELKQLRRFRKEIEKEILAH